MSEKSKVSNRPWRPWSDNAWVTVSALRAAGIDAVEADFHLRHVYPFIEFGSSRPRILVPQNHIESARAIVSSARSSEVEHTYACPDCGERSRRVRRWGTMILLWLTIGLAFPFFASRRRCGACRITWHEPPQEPFAPEELGYTPEPLKLPSWSRLAALIGKLRRA